MRRVDLLRGVEIFSELAEEDLREIAALLKEMRVADGTLIAGEGEAGDALYLIASGRVRVSVADSSGRERELELLGEGRCFGEAALATGEPYPATVRAVGAVDLLVLRREEFDPFLERNVRAMLQITKAVAERGEIPRHQPLGSSIEPQTAAAGRVFTVFSPKGGAGTTTVAVNLAVALARFRPGRVALLDLALTFGHCALMLDLAPRSNLAATTAEALWGMGHGDELDYYLSTHPGSGLKVMVGASRPEDGERVTSEMARAAIEQLRGRFEYVVVDTESHFSDPVLVAIEASDRIIVLGSPEITALRDLRECRRILSEVVCLPRARQLYVMNCPQPYRILSRGQIEEALQNELFAELPHAGDGPAKATLRGQPFLESQPGSPLARSLEELAVRLVGEVSDGVQAARREQRRGFFR